MMLNIFSNTYLPFIFPSISSLWWNVYVFWPFSNWIFFFCWVFESPLYTLVPSPLLHMRFENIFPSLWLVFSSSLHRYSLFPSFAKGVLNFDKVWFSTFFYYGSWLLQLYKKPWNWADWFCPHYSSCSKLF